MPIRLLITFILLILSTPTLAWSEEITCQLSAQEIKVRLDPSGQYVAVSGMAPENVPIIIKVEGSNIPEQVSFSQNDSWLIKYAETEILGLPGYYQVLTSVPTETISKTYWPLLGLSPSYEELNTRAWLRHRHQIEEHNLNMEEDYIKLAIQQKVDKELYAIRQGVVKRQGTYFSGAIPLVSSMPLGQLKVTAMALTPNGILTSEPKIIKISSTSPLSIGSSELAINPFLIITLFMVPIILMTSGQILEIIEERRRIRLLRNIWR